MQNKDNNYTIINGTIQSTTESEPTTIKAYKIVTYNLNDNRNYIPDILKDSVNKPIITRDKSIVIRNFNELGEPLDLTDKSISLVFIFDTRIKHSVLSALNCMAKVKFNNVLFFTSKVDDKELDIIRDYVQIIKVDAINTMYKYVETLFNIVPDYLNTKYALVCQYDGTIISSKAWNDDFLNYDYIGAPWKKAFQGEESLKYYPKYSVGNGGASLRSTKLMKLCRDDELIKNALPKDKRQEDAFLCKNSYIRKHLEEDCGIKYAPIELAIQFGYECDVEGYTHDYNRLFTMHSIHKDFVIKLLDKMNVDEFLNCVKQQYSK